MFSVTIQLNRSIIDEGSWEGVLAIVSLKDHWSLFLLFKASYGNYPWFCRTPFILHRRATAKWELCLRFLSFFLTSGYWTPCYGGSYKVTVVCLSVHSSVCSSCLVFSDIFYNGGQLEYLKTDRALFQAWAKKAKNDNPKWFFWGVGFFEKFCHYFFLEII